MQTSLCQFYNDKWRRRQRVIEGLWQSMRQHVRNYWPDYKLATLQILFRHETSPPNLEVVEITVLGTMVKTRAYKNRPLSCSTYHNVESAFSLETLAICVNIGTLTLQPFPAALERLVAAVYQFSKSLTCTTQWTRWTPIQPLQTKPVWKSGLRISATQIHSFAGIIEILTTDWADARAPDSLWSSDYTPSHSAQLVVINEIDKLYWLDCPWAVYNETVKQDSVMIHPYVRKQPKMGSRDKSKPCVLKSFGWYLPHNHPSIEVKYNLQGPSGRSWSGVQSCFTWWRQKRRRIRYQREWRNSIIQEITTTSICPLNSR